MRLANIIPGGGDEDEDGINRLFLHVYVSKPDPEDSIHFLCGLYPNALVIHSVSMRPKLRSSQFLVVPKKYSGPIFRRRRRVPATLEREEGIQKKWVLKANGVKRFKQPRACFKRLHDRRTRGFTIKIERAVPSLKLPELKPDSSLGPCARFVNR
nr:TPA_asm: hypothetical protein HUJ06_000450 [Nelumbo nucifera]